MPLTSDVIFRDDIERPWPPKKFYKKNNLVYIRTHKCASTFYMDVLTHNQWDSISESEVDWHNDHVFGFLLDPVQRYVKGIIEDIYNNDTLLHSTLEFYRDHQAQSLLYTLHSFPLSLYYGRDVVGKIDWIPLNQSVPSEVLFEKLCEKHAINIEWPRHPNLNKAKDNARKRLLTDEFDKILHMNKPLFWISMRDDIELYRSVLKNINLHGETWDEISWLRPQ